MKLVIIASVLVLTGCSSFPKVPDKIYIPVATSCIKELPTRPQFASKDYLRSLSNPDYVTAITGEFLIQGNYINELESVLGACK